MMKPLVRSLTAACAGLMIALPAGAAAQAAPLDHRELTADEQVAHALNRLAFGGRPGDAQRIRAEGLDRWIEKQLRPAGIGDEDVERFLAGFDALTRDQNELLREFAEVQQDRRQARQNGDTSRASRRETMGAAMADGALSRRQVVVQLQSARVARAVATNRQLQEVMTDFWLNHFNVFAQKGPPQPYYVADYEKAVRARSLGKFRDLLGAVARSPAMLFYLDNARSMGDTSQPRLATVNRSRARQGGLNENYGRELLELHTVGVDGGYTQKDVIDVARAFTGWTIRVPAGGGGFVFRPEMHDAGEKVVLGQRLRANRGMEDGEQVLDILAGHPSTARHIARKVAIRLVSDTPSPALIDRAAATYLRSDGDIREVVRAIVTSNEFNSRSAYRHKVKSPFEVVVSAMRAMNAAPDATPRTAQAIAFLGQPVYGHQAPNGYPETGEAWMNAGAILNRINFGIGVASGRLPGVTMNAIPGLDSLRNVSREEQVDAIARLLLGGAISPETRAVLLSGENPLLQGAQAPRLGGIAQIVGLALGSPEFQRR